MPHATGAFPAPLPSPTATGSSDQGPHRTLSKRTWLFTFSFILPFDHFCIGKGCHGR